jgi:aspartyl-tRNA(Asn)/glutamyl-tRNA(Gln) amidotransferase subunit C
MKTDDISHLARLSRLSLSDAELQSLSQELPQIMEYVSVISKLSADAASAEPTVGPRHNVFRADEVTNQPDQYYEALLAEAPQTQGRFLKVKKILSTDE